MGKATRTAEGVKAAADTRAEGFKSIYSAKTLLMTVEAWM